MVRRVFSKSRAAVLLAVALLSPLLSNPAGTSSAAAATVGLHGTVASDATPLASYPVALLATRETGDRVPVILANTSTAADGTFDLTYAAPADPHAVLYVVVTNPSDGLLTLASVLGTSPVPADIVVNERTTVATAYAMAQFTDQASISGPAPGLQNAVGMAHNLADPITGAMSSVLLTPPNSTTSTHDTFNSLANLVAKCSAGPPDCAALLAAATPPNLVTPNGAFQAIADIARNPWKNVDALFALSLTGPTPYQPARVVPPDAWTLALRFVGDGASMAGPGNMAVDSNGNVWTTNNYQYSADPLQSVCGADTLLEFAPNGQYVAGSPYHGGGLSGAGFGIDIDPYGHVWVGNFGFAAPAPGCPDAEQPPHNSISEFLLDGTPLSPDATATSGGGFTQGNVAWPQGITADDFGNVWIANCARDSVTEFPGGDPNAARELTGIGVTKAFGMAHNRDGTVFVSGVASDTVAVLGPDGVPLASSPVSGGGLDKPLGVATDSRGNAWIANSGFVDVPCPDRANIDSHGGSVTMIAPSGDLASPTAFTGGGLTIPWGVAVDGNDNVWVANFAGARLSEFCGVSVNNCRPGTGVGAPISPDVVGYGFDGLVRNTGVAIDPSGNVWLANNWKEVPLPPNPGGYEMVVYVGLAGPVHRPPPRDQPTPAPASDLSPVATPVNARPSFTG